MKLHTKLDKGPPYRFEYRLVVSDSERALIDLADAWDYQLAHGTDLVDGISVRSFLQGSSFQAEDLLRIQVMESNTHTAVQKLQELLHTLEGFGRPRVKEF